ncbi:MAG: helix-turn-helix transcriptional regulator [Nanoarchaeota archaeon]
MEQWTPQPKNELVEAIEEGKIVKVTEEYAHREGLLVLRKHRLQVQEKQQKSKKELENLPELQDMRKAQYYKGNQVISELIDNFQWHIIKKRRALGLTRKRLAEKLGEHENTIKLMENGVLPREDFVIVNKLQNFFNFNLRKDKKDFAQSPRSLISQKQENTELKAEKSDSEIKTKMSGDDIELIE